MHPRFLSLLRCPHSGSELQLEIDDLWENGSVRTGTLVAEGGRRRYPIISGIPRFVSAEFYSGTFGYEWRKWPRVQFEAENVGGPMEGHTARMFGAVTGLAEADLRDKLVVEFGCGPGRFLDVVRRRGGIAVGIDMSIAVESARENLGDDESVLIVQGDILNPPFRKGAFDHGYSVGVLHHTPDPAKGLEILAGLVRSGGGVSCCVYPRGGFYDYRSVYLFRSIHRLMSAGLGARFATRMALAYSSLSAYLLYHLFRFAGLIPLCGARVVRAVERNLLVNVRLPDARWRVLDVFDAITPRYASTHTAEEVREWLVGAGCVDLRQTPWCDTSFTARKS